MCTMFKKVQWEYHPSHLKVLLADLYESSDFSDVTIICDGNSKLKVQKVILALYSGFFSELFGQHIDEEVIIMPEVNHNDIVAILDLIFTAKSSIHIDRLDSILSLANELQIKNFEENNLTIQCSAQSKTTSIKESKRDNIPLNLNQHILTVKSEPLESMIFQESFGQAKDFQMPQLNNKPKDRLPTVKNQELLQKVPKISKGNPVATSITDPIPFDNIGEIKFIKTENSFDCKLCGKEFRTKGGVQVHHKREHLKRRFICSACEAEFKTREHLRVHFRVHHEGIKLKCEQCSTTHTTKAGLKQHVTTIHEGKKWRCHICLKEYSQKGALKAHVNGQHYGFKYQCLYCQHSDADSSNLNKHVKKKHPEKKKSKDPLYTKYAPRLS